LRAGASRLGRHRRLSRAAVLAGGDGADGKHPEVAAKTEPESLAEQADAAAGDDDPGEGKFSDLLELIGDGEESPFHSDGFDTMIADRERFNAARTAVLTEEVKARGAEAAAVSPEFNTEELELFDAFGEIQDEGGVSYDDFMEDEPEEAEEPAYAGVMNGPDMSRRGFFREYESRAQNKEILRHLNASRLSAAARTLICGILLAFTLYLESAAAFGWPLPETLNVEYYNVIYILAELQALVIVCALCWRALLSGIVSLVRLFPNYYSFASVAVVCAFLHTIFTFILRYNSPMRLYNSAAVFTVLMLCLFDWMDSRRQRASFRAVSAREPKYALETEPAGCADAAAFREVTGGEGECAFAAKTEFVERFFANTYKAMHRSPAIRLTAVAALFAALMALVVMLISTGGSDLYDSLSAPAFMLLFILPACAPLGYMYVLYKSQEQARSLGGALIGNAGLEDHKDLSVAAVNDVDIFPPSFIKIAAYKMYGENRLDEALRRIALLFGRLNSPFAAELRSSSGIMSGEGSVEVTELRADGVCAVVDGERVFAGRASFMDGLGFKVPVDHEYDTAFSKGFGGILFFADVTGVILKVYIKYETAEGFADMVKAMHAADICLAVRTCDPNIDDELLYKFIRSRKFKVKVIKQTQPPAEPPVRERASSGIVARSFISLVHTAIIGGRLGYMTKCSAMVYFCSFVMGLIIASAALALGSAEHINSLYMVLFQAFWAVPMLLLTNIVQK